MNCECLENIKEHIRKNSTYSKPIESVEVVDIGFVFQSPGTGTRTLSHIEVALAGRKKKEVINMLHNFCPFCGKAQNVDEEADDTTTKSSQITL